MRGAVRAVLAIALATAFGANGCSWRKTVWELGMPGYGMELLVVYVEERGPYLDAGLVGHGLDLRTFVPANDVCRTVLNTEEPVRYVERGVAGAFERAGYSCDAVGYGDPLIRGARQPRQSRPGDSVVPRAQATFRMLYEDNDVVLLRGRFPLASRIGWSGADDSVVVIDNVARCRGVIESGVATMEYRQAGRNTLSLVGDGGPCRIQGLIQPLDRARPRDTAAP
jgi:hypothetical protein